MKLGGGRWSGLYFRQSSAQSKSMNYTKTPNVILEAMPSMTHVEAKLTAVLIRHTFGWHTPECKLTWDEMVALAGLSKGSIAKAMDEVERRGFFMRGRKSVWRVNSSFIELFTVQNVDESSEIELLESSEIELNSVDESSEIELPSIKEKKEPKGSNKKNGGAVNPPHPVWDIPKPLKTPEFEDAWVSWFRHRHEQGKYLTQTSGDTVLVDLAKMGIDRAIAAIRHSISRGWLNIYEPETPTRASLNGTQKTQQEIIAETLAEIGEW